MNLKNSLIGLMLMAVSAGAMAEWTKTGGGDNPSTGAFDHYVDLSTIRKSGNTAKMWTLNDYKKAQIVGNGKSYLSTMGRQEYDCNEEKFRVLSLYFYSGNMKNGDLVLSDDTEDTQWRSIPPESISAAQFKIACGAK
jgi:hypothetical protein